MMVDCTLLMPAEKPHILSVYIATQNCSKVQIGTVDMSIQIGCRCLVKTTASLSEISAIFSKNEPKFSQLFLLLQFDNFR